jgi:hypothetical protein
MNLFTITAPIISFVAGIFVGPYFFPERVDLSLCDEIGGLEQVQRWSFGDFDGARLPICPGTTSQQPGEAYVNGGGTLARFFGQSKGTSFDRPKSVASAP